MDAITYFLPMPTVFTKLTLPLKQRIGLMMIFGVGSLVQAAGVMRIYWTHYVVYETYDVTWDGFLLWIWTAVEVSLGVICGSIPALRSFLIPRRLRSTAYGRREISSFGPSQPDPETGAEDMRKLTATTGVLRTKGS